MPYMDTKPHVLARDMRVGRGWSQAQLAVIAGVSPSTVYRFEAGRQVAETTRFRLACTLALSPRDAA